MQLDWNKFDKGGVAHVRELLEMESVLKKANTIGYQTPAQADGAAYLSPLVPQSIENTLFMATFSNEEIVVWPDVPRTTATNTVHEFNRMESWGASSIDPFFPEGGTPITSQDASTREYVRIRYIAAKRVISDVATTVGFMGVRPEALAHETEAGTIYLTGQLEHALFFADSANNPLAFDGILKQIRTGAPNNVVDLGGSMLTPELLVYFLGWLYEEPRYGVVNTICVEPTIHAALIQAAIAYGRHDHMNQREGTGITFGVEKLYVQASYGKVEIRSVPMLFRAKAPNTSAIAMEGETAPVAAITTQPVHDGALSGTSQWGAADEGDYIYKIVAVAPSKGISAPVTSDPVSVTAGQKIKIVMTLESVHGESNSDPDKTTYYRVFRSRVNGDASTCKLIAEVPINTDGTLKTRIVDLNATRYNTGYAFFLRLKDMKSLHFAQLLPFLRRPLHSLKTTIPFMLMLFGAPVCPVPTKLLVLTNVGKPDPLSIG